MIQPILKLKKQKYIILKINENKINKQTNKPDILANSTPQPYNGKYSLPIYRKGTTFYEHPDELSINNIV